jgi:hypothetical protein
MAANAVLQDAKLTIIPIAIGILGYTYGALLAVFLLGMLTRSRGRDGVNVIAMIVGITSVLILCKVSLPAFDVGALYGASSSTRTGSLAGSCLIGGRRSPGLGSCVSGAS